MVELTTLTEALETTREDMFLARINSPARETHENPLFFPRKKLKMTKIRSGYWTPRAWFIQERLDEKATHLDRPTQATHEGLTSGFRSAIIKNPDGTYTKLKGVSLKDATPKYKTGLCSPSEAYAELMNINLLNCMFENLIPAAPEFIEIYRNPPQPINLKRFLNDFRKSATRASWNPVSPGEWDKLKIEGRRIEAYFSKTPLLKENEYFVSGIRITGDTRLDETCYHLTKKELSGRLKEKRDEILTYLFFRAGVMKGIMTSCGATWSDSLTISNSHLGNFAIFSRGGILEAGIVDVGSLKFIHNFPNVKEFLEFANQEIDDFQYEFEKTAGLTVQTRYRHFPEELKRDCLDSLKTGYGVVLLNESKANRDLLTSYTPQRIIVPKSAAIPIDEFKDFLKEMRAA